MVLRYGGEIMYIILVYDISIEDNGKRNIAKVFKVCKKYLSHIQNSTFEGELTQSQLLRLKSELSPYIRKELDSVIVFHTNNEKWLKKEFWGIKYDATSNMI
jgi:CRISPR-associated protein Cas2